MSIEMLIAGTISLVLLWGIAISFILIIRYYTKRNKPMHLWTGTTIDPKSISDISAFNKSVSKLFMTYASVFFLGGILTFFFIEIGFIVTIAASLLGIIPLGIIYHRITNKYKS